MFIIISFNINFAPSYSNYDYVPTVFALHNITALNQKRMRIMNL